MLKLVLYRCNAVHCRNLPGCKPAHKAGLRVQNYGTGLINCYTIYMKRYLILIAAVGVFMATAAVMATTELGSQLASVIGATDDRYVRACLIEHGYNETVPASAKRISLDTDSASDLALMLEGDAHCGNTGCRHELCIIKDDNVTAIPFGLAGSAIRSLHVVTEGRRNLILTTGNGDTELEWDGNFYVLSE